MLPTLLCPQNWCSALIPAPHCHCPMIPASPQKPVGTHSARTLGWVNGMRLCLGAGSWHSDSVGLGPETICSLHTPAHGNYTRAGVYKKRIVALPLALCQHHPKILGCPWPHLLILLLDTAPCQPVTPSQPPGQAPCPCRSCPWQWVCNGRDGVARQWGWGWFITVNYFVLALEYRARD